MWVPTRAVRSSNPQGLGKVDTLATERSLDPTASQCLVRRGDISYSPSIRANCAPSSNSNSNNQPPINLATIPFSIPTPFSFSHNLFFLSVVIFSQCPISSVTITVCDGRHSIDIVRRIPAAVVWTHYGKSNGRWDYTLHIQYPSRNTRSTRHCRANKTISDLEVGFNGCNVTTIWPLPYPRIDQYSTEMYKGPQVYIILWQIVASDFVALRGIYPKLSVIRKTETTCHPWF